MCTYTRAQPTWHCKTAHWRARAQCIYTFSENWFTRTTGCVHVFASEKSLIESFDFCRSTCTSMCIWSCLHTCAEIRSWKMSLFFLTGQCHEKILEEEMWFYFSKICCCHNATTTLYYLLKIWRILICSVCHFVTRHCASETISIMYIRETSAKNNRLMRIGVYLWQDEKLINCIYSRQNKNGFTVQHAHSQCPTSQYIRAQKTNA